jgi:hypothetical protein
LKIHAIARNVSGVIARRPSTVANAVPKRIPRYAGMKKRTMPMKAMTSVGHAMNVLIGVKPPAVAGSTLKPNRSARYHDARIMLSGATGNHPSQ